MKILEIKVICEADYYCDCWKDVYGDWTNNSSDWAISRKYKKYFAELTSVEKEDSFNFGHSLPYFKPESGGEKEGSVKYKKYGMQNWERCEKLSDGYWNYIDITSKAMVQFQKDGVIQEIISGGLTGIESDDKEGIEQFKKEQLDILESELLVIGFNKEDIKKAISEARTEEK